MKRQILVNGLLSLTAVSMLTCCVDDKYDLTDIDTTSRFTVDNLTVPVNVSEIKLKNVINLDDNENISNVDGEYAIVKGGEISPTEFKIGNIHVDQPTFDPSTFSVNDVPGGGTYIPSSFDVPAIKFPAIDLQPYDFSMEDIDSSLEVLKNVKTKENIAIKVVLNILTQEILGAGNSIAFQDLKIQLPWGLITDEVGYDNKTGMLTVDEIAVVDGKAILTINASGLDLGDKGTVEGGKLNIDGMVGVESGKIKMSVSNITLPTSIEIRADYSVSSFDLASFSGKINYQMDNIDIDPISLSGLPDFLDSPQTNLIIANPQILVSFKNPVGKYGLSGSGVITLTSVFKNGQSVEHNSDPFVLSGENTNLAFCTPKAGYADVKFDGLRNVLANGNSGLPESIKVNIHDIRFASDVTDFPLGDLGSAEGSYEFNAPLGFGDGSRVIYETTVDGWSSDALDDVNITLINLHAKCSTNLPVSVQLKVTPIDKNGREIPVDEDSGLFSVPAKANEHQVALKIKSVDGPINNLDGVKFHAVVEQNSPDNTDALGPNLEISFDDIRVTVDGYYETDF